jgi:hypothetical protein
MIDAIAACTSPRITGLLLACGLALSACQAATPAADITSPAAAGSTGAVPASEAAGTGQADSASLLRQMQQQIGTAACTADSQCRTVPIGHKACGGPEGYLPWSTAATPDEARLRALAAAQAEASRVEVAKSGRVSNCMMVIDPGARCGPDHRCQLSPRTPLNPMPAR